MSVTLPVNTPFQMLGTTMTVKVSAADTGGTCAMVEQITPPGWGPPLHVHTREDEMMYVLDGEYEVRLGDQTLRVTAGQAVGMPRNVPHTFKNVGATDGRLLAVMTPGTLEPYFHEIAQLSGPPSPQLVAPIAERYGLTMLGPA